MQIWQLPTRTAVDGQSLAQMRFDVKRLEFYRWLVQHGRHPEWSSLPDETLTVEQAFRVFERAVYGERRQFIPGLPPTSRL